MATIASAIPTNSFSYERGIFGYKLGIFGYKLGIFGYEPGTFGYRSSGQIMVSGHGYYTLHFTSLSMIALLLFKTTLQL